MSPRIRPLFLAFLFLAFAGNASAQNNTSIGEGGGKLDLGTDWKRGVIEASLGKDQFVSRRAFPDAGVIVIELANIVLHGEADLRWVVQQGLNQSKERFSQATITPATTELIHGRPLVVQKLSGTSAGIEIDFFAAGIGGEGLGYMLMSFGIKGREETLRAGLIDIAKRIEFPGADSEWAKSRELVSRTVSLAEGNVATLKYRPCYWLPNDEDSNALVGLETPGYEAALWVLSRESHSIESAMNEAEDDAFSDWPKRLRSSEEPLTILGRPALIRTFDLNSNPSMTGFLLEVELDRGVYLDLRVVADSRPGEFRPLIDEFIGGISFPARVEAFPTPGLTKPPIKASPAEATLLRIAEVVGEFPDWPASVVELDGKYISASSDRFDVLDPRTSTVESTTADNSYNFSMTTQRGRVLILSPGQEMKTFFEGRVRNTNVTGDLITRGPRESLILARQAVLGFTPGFNSWSTEGTCELIQRTRGEELQLASFPAAAPEQLQTDLEQENLLFVMNQEGQGHWATGYEAIAIDLATGEQTALGAWTNVAHAAAAPGSWLVQGTPRNLTNGLYQLWPSGKMERLYSGQCIPESLNEKGDLVFVPSFQFNPSSQDPDAVVLLRVKRDVIIDFDRANDLPAISSFLTAINLAGSLPAFDAKWETRQAYLDKLDDELEKLGLASSPRTPAAVDHWIQAYTQSTALTNDGEQVLSLILSRVLVDAGALFVPGQFATGSISRSIPVDQVGAFGAVPLDAVRSIQMEDSYWWAPADQVIERAQGRTILIGPDSESLFQAAAQFQLRDEALAAVADGLNACRALLDEHESDEHLRRFLYPRLVEAGDHSLRMKFARDAWNRDSRKAIDLLQFADAALALGVDAEVHERLIRELKNAIGRGPEEADLFLVLGRCYLARGLEGDAERARTCLLEAVDRTWGEAKQAAQAALDSIK